MAGQGQPPDLPGTITVPAVSGSLADDAIRLRLVLQAGGFGTWSWDLGTGVTVWDEAMERAFGLPPGAFDGTFDAWVRLLHPAERDRIVADIDTALVRRGTYELRHRVVWPDGSVHWIEGLGRITVNADGEPTGSIGCARDVTRQVLAEEQLAAVAGAAALAAERAEHLQVMTADLSRALTVPDAAKAIEGHADGLLGATSGAVAVVGETGTTIAVPASFGYDPTVVAEYAKVPIDASTPMTDCLRTGRAQVLTVAQVQARYPDLIAAVLAGGHSLLVALPLEVPGRKLGALLLSFADRDALSSDELSFAMAVAGQCSQALERARLLGRLSTVAATLQRGLALDDLPTVPGIELAAVYQPGGDEMEHLGGDWYDVLVLEDSRAAIVIGDVMGRGIVASTIMTRIRTAVRAYAEVDPTPVVVMSKLDRFIRREAPDDFVTMVYGVLEPEPGTLELINAGHLPPLLLNGDEPSRQLGHGSGVPLGLTQQPRDVVPVELADGAALLLYTDGLVERRDRDIDAGLDSLAAAAAHTSSSMPLQQTLDTLVAVTTAGEPAGDDVTALMIRRTPRG